VRNPFFEKGQGLVEYSLILVLVAIVVIGILVVLGPAVGNVFSGVVDALQAYDDAPGGPPGASFGSGWLFVMLVIMALTNSISGHKRPRTQAES
jgi:pilus assembly protein Flp/PilA